VLGETHDVGSGLEKRSVKQLKKESTSKQNRGDCQNNGRRRNKSWMNSNCQIEYKRGSVDKVGDTDRTKNESEEYLAKRKLVGDAERRWKTRN
jgi:hypothetical protein